jgi:ATP-dependent Clp protease ATP-binding subunit ClpA
VLLLHGNVRDCYVDDKDRSYDNLTGLLKDLAASFEGQTFTQFQMCDLVSGIRIRHLSAEPTAQVSEPASNTPTNEPKLRGAMRELARWRRDLASTADNWFAVLFYLDKLISYKQSYGSEEAEAILWLEKIIENITPNNRLVLVALQDTMVPVEVYTHSPKCRVVQIPVPDADDRARCVCRRLGEEHPHAKLIADLTDGLYMRELERVVAKVSAAQHPDAHTVRQIINHYRFGAQVDYWGQLDIRRLDRASHWFTKEEGIKGQDEPVERVVQMLQMARAGLSGIASGTAAKPKGVLFFAGPTGVGKTFLAKKLAKFLFSSEDAFIRFDMSEFKEEHTVSKLIGSPPGYIGSERGGTLTNAIRERPFSVVLFDEIEKAHPKVMDIFLQILDDGRLSDSRGQTAFFSEAVIIFTSNVGSRSKDSRDNPLGEKDLLDKLRDTEGRDTAEVKHKIRRHFVDCVRNFFSVEISRPELLNRIGGNIVPFNFIDGEDVQREIVTAILHRIKASFEELERNKAAGYRLEFDDAVISHLVARHSDTMSAYGGRGITNEISTELIQPLLAPELLRAEYSDEHGTVFRITVVGEALLVERECAPSTALA